MKVTLLGPQRRPTVDAVMRSLHPGGPVATITAGWRDGEANDGELGKLLGSRHVNLRLYRRWLDVQERDQDFAAADRRLRGVLAEVQEIYLLRLDYALRAVYAVQRRNGNVQALAEELAEAIAAVRELDAAHLRRIGDIRGEFYQAWPPHSRPVIAAHRAGHPAPVQCRGGAALAGDCLVGGRDGTDRPDRALSRPGTAGTRSP